MDRLVQQALKSGLIELYRRFEATEYVSQRGEQDKPDILGLPVYFVDGTGMSIDEGSELIRSMQEFPEIPWPEDRCVVAAVDPFLTVPGKAVAMRFYIRHPFLSSGLDLEWARAEVSPNTYAIDRVEMMNWVYTRGSGKGQVQSTIMHQVDVGRFGPREFRMNGTREMVGWPEMRRRTIDFNAERVEKFTERFGLVQGYRQMLESVIPRESGRCWLVTNMKDVLRDHLFCGQPADAVYLLETLLPFLAPCGYRVKARFRDGFGGRRIRRATRGKPIFTTIAYQRMQTIFRESIPEHTKTPHFRRGHIRHMWQEAGVDRRTLPARPGDRLRLVREKSVRRVYVQPAWIGPKQIEHEGVQYEQDGVEVQL